MPLYLAEEYIYWSHKCLMGFSICCTLELFGPYYNYKCICHPDGLLDDIPVGYTLIKTCDIEEPICYQNNLFSPELYCDCNDPFKKENNFINKMN